MSKTFAAADLVRHPRKVYDAAKTGLVFLTHHRRENFVLMSIEQYAALTNASPNPQRVVDVAKISKEDAEEFLAAAASLLTEADRGDA